ncbi:DNA repair protein RadC [Vineibacter terrae]|uniref:DNA repair protein RadC n=1 Tax=Vineibacter terrae TaxID=2586908 RepID=A0A5C8PEL1_9HYPH|nr:DNA repair protein RadC [Vineibacter terrae]TXL71773.1 DNA repair protein RadC [Vineibacter terrae]
MSYVEGHRQRLRDRFNESGLGAFENHEVLELLLKYALPRKDVKPIAHALLERLGSLSNVLDAPTAELVKVDGVGEIGATLLHLMPRLTRRCLRDRWGHKPQLNTREDLGPFVVDELATATIEVFLLVLLTHENHVVRALPLHEGSLASAPVYPRLIVEAALRHHAAKVVLAHNHPGGVAQPSDEDLTVTRTLVSVFDALGVPDIDHLIVAGRRTFTMAEAEFLRVDAGAPT